MNLSGNVTAEIEIKRNTDSTHKLYLTIELHDGFYRDQIVILRSSFHPKESTVNEEGNSFSFKTDFVLVTKTHQKELTDYWNQS